MYQQAQVGLNGIKQAFSIPQGPNSIGYQFTPSHLNSPYQGPTGPWSASLQPQSILGPNPFQPQFSTTPYGLNPGSLWGSPLNKGPYNPLAELANPYLNPYNRAGFGMGQPTGQVIYDAEGPKLATPYGLIPVHPLVAQQLATASLLAGQRALSSGLGFGPVYYGPAQLGANPFLSGTPFGLTGTPYGLHPAQNLAGFDPYYGGICGGGL